MVKCVVDTKKKIVALNAELHSDLESLLLESGSDNRNLYGININLETFEIEYDLLINPPRNREAGHLKQSNPQQIFAKVYQRKFFCGSLFIFTSPVCK